MGGGRHPHDWERQREQLSAYIDGELSAAERAELERHIPGCPECQEALGELRRVHDLLAALPMPKAPRSFALPLDTRLPTRPAQPASQQAATQAAQAAQAQAATAQAAAVAAQNQAVTALSQSQAAQVQAASAQQAVPPLEKAIKTGWFANTSISGKGFVNISNIHHTRAGVDQADDGTETELKRFYIGVDHKFSDVFSANVTTDFRYNTNGSTGNDVLVYLKKAYLQAKIDPLLTVRVGAADTPWVPYAEGIYGMRYFEQVIVDRTKFGTSSDWGVHVLGSAFNGILNYDFAALNGGGYKKIPVGAGTNRAANFDYEGRVSAVYQGFNLAVGGYTGKLGTAFGTPTFHTAQRFNVLGAYVANGLRLGVEYFNANDFSAALVASSTPGDAAHGVSSFGSYYFLPEWAVFARYDSVATNTRTAPAKNNEYYTLGLTWSPVKIVDFSLAYKHDAVRGGSFTDANGTIGSATGAQRGTYNEFGVWGNLQW